MSSEPEEVPDERMDRIQRRAENFRELLKDGEEVTIACYNGEVLVEESYRSQLERKHSKLFGRLLSVEAQLEFGLLPYFLGLVVVGFLLFGLHLEWWEPLLGRNVSDQLDNWWFAVVLAASVLFLVSVGAGQWRRQVYRRHRSNLLEMIALEKLDRDIMLVMLRDTDELNNIVQELKLDNGPFPGSM